MATAISGKVVGDGTVEGERQLKKKFGVSCSVMLSVASRPETQNDVTKFAVQVNDKNIIVFGSVHPFFIAMYLKA